MPSGYHTFPHTALNIVGDAELLRELVSAWEEMLAVPPGSGMTDEQYTRWESVHRRAGNAVTVQLAHVAKSGDVARIPDDVMETIVGEKAC
jgi:hypothetical protein